MPPNVKVDASSKSQLADQDDENRITPAGFDDNGEETWNWTRHAALVRTGRYSPNLASVTFSSSQELVIVPEVRDKLLDAWGIDSGVRVGAFSREQNAYLDYHRVNVFKHSLLEP